MPRQQLYQPEIVEDCGKVAELLHDTWSIKLILACTTPKRFSELQHGLGISSKTLSKRLKSLEQQGIVSRTLYAQVPLRVEYELTEKGFELKSLFEEIVKWDRKWS
jgi:DNA-binding HxlR family transcriptional regulator